MSCNCKKKVQKIVEYDRKLSGKDGDVQYETIIEESEEVHTNWFEKIINSILGLLKTILIVVLALIALVFVIISIFVWIVWNSFTRFVLKKESKLNSPFYEYDKIKKKVKEHNEKVRQFFESKKEIPVDKTITIQQ